MKRLFRFHLLFSLALILLALSFCLPAKAGQIPRAANKYKNELIRVARYEFGLNAPTALLAAQIHQESAWRESVTSHAGAQGLAQFMPATARWLPEVVPSLREAEKGNIFNTPKEKLPFNPSWSLRAMCAYNKWHLDRLRSSRTSCDRWAFALSAYNGGLGWVQRDQRLAAQKGYDRYRYWGHVEMVNAGRSQANIKENRQYPKRIFNRAPIYEAAGWGPGVSCD